MVWAAPATSLCLRFSTDLVKVAVATLLIGAALSATEQHPDLPAPQGFLCIPALPAAALLAFARGLQNKPEKLSSVQLSCLAHLLSAKNPTAHFGRYLPNLLLFFDLAEVDSETCGAFYSRASHGNLDLLPRGSVQRQELLQRALACLGVRSSHLQPEQLSSLGALVCDMEPETITASDPGVLENLKLCPVLTGAQQDALNAVLLGGGTVYGDPSSWDLQTLDRLGPLVLALNQTTLSLVPKATQEAFGRTITATYSSQRHSQWEKSLTLLRAFPAAVALSHPRLKRTTEGCPSSPITASTISDTLLFLIYSVDEFYLCLSDEVLTANLKLLSEQPLPREFLMVMKKRLSEIYPSGIPEKQLKELGTLSRLYTPKEISQWMVTSSDTLLALLNPSDGQWNPAQVNQLLKRYKALGGTLMGSTLTGPLLQTIGGRNLCNLQEEQIDKIPLEAIRTAGQLNISSCSQAKKDQLYRKACYVFGDKANSISVYYCLIRPYLGGAPADDLKRLAERGTAINMDMGTFLHLNPKELQKLSVMDVKNLLGKNLPYLKAAENETVVVEWVKRQSQQELDCGSSRYPSPKAALLP
ncbi:PREDICTED: mesothelin [Chaetura pelagica]|uniref:mesothelin n=1 Tax=Chaetura pelagica TaxID=8897 RepID=UPI000523A4A8|nr:PREDICTED: mesothelin [Chaetura pelagica]